MAITLATCHVLALLAGVALVPQDFTGDPSPLVKEFLAAQTPADRADAASKILGSDASFEGVFADLRRGRVYASDVPRGRLLREHEINGVRHPYMILVPEDYAPGKKLPVRFDLHGGMGAKEWKKLDGAWCQGWTKSSNQIIVFPAGWWDSMWWEASQVENFEAILREVRATWNTDENRVVLTGSSDGGAGLFFQAMRRPDRWSGYLGFVGPPDRLLRKDFRPDGQMHMSNLSGQKFLLGYGEKDKKVPLRYIEKYMELFLQAGALLEWYVLEGQGHSLQIPEERMQEFIQHLWGLVRDPLPDELSWATEDPKRYGRRSWLVIEELGKETDVDGDEILPRLGTRLQLRGPTTPRVPWGRVRLHREGNLVQAQVTNVARFTLLISPDEFDLEQLVRVEVGGRVLFEQKVEPSLGTLLKYAALDDDRTRLFAAAIEITLDPED